MKKVLSNLLPKTGDYEGIDCELNLYHRSEHNRGLIYNILKLGNQAGTYSLAVGRKILDEKTNSIT